jgi:threonine aldolase
MSDIDEVRSRCHNVLPGHDMPVSLAGTLRDIADSLDGSEQGDVYGSGSYLSEFEAGLATEFGKESAVFMPSGTMAQQIALRLWCEKSGRPGIAMHPTAHLETAEYLGYQQLHRLHRIEFGAPEVLHNRLLSLADLEALPEKPGAVLLEIPCRPLGGEMPDWEDLTAICDWARTMDIPIHLDGARIWQCRVAYGRSFAEIGALFDSIYVSFYKDLGGLAGCMLMGPNTFIAESRIWQRRHGGNLFSQAPYVAAAKQGLARRLPQLAAWNRKAVEIAAIVNSVAGMKTRPVIPRVNFFQVFLEAEAAALEMAHTQLASDTGTFVFSAFRATAVPGLSVAELHCWGNAMAFDCGELEQFLGSLISMSAVTGDRFI